jgi:hypothetical protein
VNKIRETAVEELLEVVTAKRVSILVALAGLGLVVSSCTASTSRSIGQRPTTTRTPSPLRPVLAVDTEERPSAWEPVDYRRAQISVPVGWNVGYDSGATARTILGSFRPSSASRSPSPVEIRLVLSATQVVAGTPIRAEALLTNTTGRTITVNTCAADGWLFVGLTNNRVRYDALRLMMACRPTVHLRPGVNRFAVSISTRFQGCTETLSEATPQLPACIPPETMPPLPVGKYTTKVVTFGLPHGTQLPSPITVTLLATSTPVSQGPWPENVIARANLAPQTAVLIPGSAASSKTFAFGFAINGCIEPCSEPIVRLDLRSGSFKVGPVMSAASFIETVWGRIVVFTAQKVSLQGIVTGGWSLRTVNASTLQLGPPVQLPFLGNTYWFSVTSGVSGTDDVWINDGGVLLLLNTATGKIVRREHSGPAGASLALSPDGRILYALGYVSRANDARGLVREFNAITGQVLATRRQPFLSGGTAGLTSVEEGVWVTSYLSSVSLLSSDGLRPMALPQGALPVDPPSATAYRGFTAYDLGAFLLLESYRGMTCLAPTTGSLRATALWTAKQAPSWTPVALVGHILVGLQITSFTSSKVLAVHVPEACLG